MANNLLMILGPTASGKTRLGVEVTRELGGEIVSADSRQVYRGLDIGAGKDLHEYSSGGPAVAYHLIDVVGLDFEFSVFEYQKRFFSVFEDLQVRGIPAIVVGGSGLYLDAVLNDCRMVDVPPDPALREGLKPLSNEALVRRLQVLRPVHNTTDLEDRERLVRAIEIARYSADHEPEPGPERKPVVLGVRWDRRVLRSRIRERLASRLQHGLIDEVRDLHDQGVSWEKLHFLGLEYRFVSDFLRGRIKNENDLRQKLAAAIIGFAKRQETWFRRMQRRGTEIHWIERGNVNQALQVIESCGGLVSRSDHA
ncbi:MAG: tRNA (adenosine(37)-N6)-dimethylallyltransferase MiaA [bacterium]|nr:tRNA (adenosine(37)-N6)-dimethylallyltransferase MiaA [bacterium]